MILDEERNMKMIKTIVSRILFEVYRRNWLVNVYYGTDPVRCSLRIYGSQDAYRVSELIATLDSSCLVVLDANRKEMGHVHFQYSAKGLDCIKSYSPSLQELVDPAHDLINDLTEIFN